MNKIGIITCLVLVSMNLFAQKPDKSETQTDKKKESYHIKIEKEVDGVKTSIDRTYHSLEELKADTALTNMHVFGDDTYTFLFKDDNEDHDFNMAFNNDFEAFFPKGKHSFYFDSEGEDGAFSINDFDVWTDDNGKVYIEHGGEEITGDKWINENGMEFHIKKSDKHVWFGTEADDVFDAHDGDKITNKIIIRTREHTNIHVENLDNNDFESLLDNRQKELTLKTISFYPNVNDGSIRLTFKGPKNTTMISILTSDGKQVFREDIPSFNGSYDQTIDLSNQRKGKYLLQLIQGSKAMNRKIIIE